MVWFCSASNLAYWLWFAYYTKKTIACVCVTHQEIYLHADSGSSYDRMCVHLCSSSLFERNVVHTGEEPVGKTISPDIHTNTQTCYERRHQRWYAREMLFIIVRGVERWFKNRPICIKLTWFPLSIVLSDWLMEVMILCPVPGSLNNVCFKSFIRQNKDT